MKYEQWNKKQYLDDIYCALTTVFAFAQINDISN